jgi:hypothetical protein
MTLADIAWLSLAAYAAHMLEEFMLNWRDWARAVIRLPVEWPDFYVTNGIVVVLGIAAASLAPRMALAPLVFAALMLINATFFHVLPMIVTRGRYSPGVASAVVLFFPAGIGAFMAAHEEGRLTLGNGVAAFAIGAALMAYPIVLMRLRQRAYFRQA